MRISGLLATAAIVALSGPVGVQAQSSNKVVPAEFPPASYAGRQYVDSKGCVFIRAGVDGAVTWVPRVTRGRQQVCGFQPTLSGAQIAAARAPRATADPAPAATAAVAPVVVRAPAPVAPAPRVVVAARTPPGPVVAPAMPAPLPKVVVAPAPTPVAAPRRQVAAATCPGVSALSQQYLGFELGHDVRCGPQGAPHVTERATASAGALVYRLGPAPSAARLSAAYRQDGAVYATHAAPVRVAPKRVYDSQKASTAGIYVPPGYAAVWEDDRLNPRRAHQTFAGMAQTDRTWTRTVPRELIPADTGPVVTRNSVVTMSTHTYALAPAAAPVAVSTKGQAPAASAAPASHRYVQLGAFSDPEHARRTAQQIANSGLPARMGDITRDGTAYTLVLAGPFDTQAALENGMNRVRGMGFAEAVLRR